MKYVYVMLVAILMAGCNGSKNESYAGVPTDGKSCAEFYQNQANVAKCIQQDGSH